MNTHRSFRLTHSDSVLEPFRSGLALPLMQQLLVLVFASMILDGGETFQIFCYAALAYWVCVAIILIRRRRQLTKIDTIVIRIGFIVACAISVVLTRFIWHMRGV